MDKVRSQTLELPFDIKKNLVSTYGLTVEQAQFIYSYPELTEYFEQV